MSLDFRGFTINIPDEREAVYEKLKNAIEYLNDFIGDEKNVDAVHKIRAIRALSEIAKTLRTFIQDEEKIIELEKEVEELKRLVLKRRDG